MQKASIYCRVSSQKKVTKDDSINSQLQRCQKYASEMAYQINKHFLDKGISEDILSDLE